MHAGRRPTRPTAVRKEDGGLTQCPAEVLDRWHQHFNKLLNQQSQYREDVMEQMPELPPCHDLEPPTEEELGIALSKMKRGKAGGKSGILPELVLVGEAVLWDRLLELMRALWTEGEVERCGGSAYNQERRPPMVR